MPISNTKIAIAIVAIGVAVLVAARLGEGDPCKGPNPPGVYCADVKGPNWVREFNASRQ